MPTNTNDRPEDEDEAQRGAQRQGGTDDPRKDEVSSPAPGGIDPKRGESPTYPTDDDDPAD